MYETGNYVYLPLLIEWREHINSGKVDKIPSGRETINNSRMKTVVFLFGYLRGLLDPRRAERVGDARAGPHQPEFRKVYGRFRAGRIRFTTDDGMPLGYAPPPVRQVVGSPVRCPAWERYRPAVQL